MQENEPQRSPGEDLAQRGEEARDAAQEKARAAQDAATRAAQEARTRAAAEVHGRAEAAQRQAGHEVGDLARALDRAAGEMEEGSWTAPLLREAAATLESAARDIEGRSPEQMVEASSRFARRNPALFLGGAALAGFALSRFATARRPDHDGRDAGGHGLGEPHGGARPPMPPPAPETHAAPPAGPVPGGPAMPSDRTKP